MPEWKGLLLPASRGERPIIDGGRTPVAYSSSDADNWKCAPLVLCIGHLRFCFLLDLAIYCF